MPRGFEGERESQRANDPSGRSGQGGGGGRERAMEAARQAAVQQAALDVSAARQRQQQEQAAQAAIAANIAQQQMAQRAEEAKSYAAAQQLANIATQRAMKGAQLTGMMPSMMAINYLTGMTPERRGLASATKFLSMPNVSLNAYGVPTAPIAGGGRVTMNRFGGVTYSGMPQEGYEGAYANLIAPAPESQADGRPEQVAPVQDPVTGQARCPEGYYFNETLQACIMDTRSTSPFQPTAPTAPSGDYYARMGLLDQPPSGLLEAGFGTPQDFAAANTAFRRGAATRPDIYTDPYNLQGYTLLS